MTRLTIALTMLALGLAAGCGSDTSTAPSPAPGDLIIVKGASALTTTAFDPNPDALTLGSPGTVSVRWVNTDGGGGAYGGGTGVTHQIASDDGGFATSEPLAVGSTYSIVLTKPGTYHYHCAIHPTMVGTLTVAP
jgi:plastocyanin